MNEMNKMVGSLERESLERNDDGDRLSGAGGESLNELSGMMARLRSENQELRGEIAVLADKQTMAVERLLMCLGVLTQFQKPEIREAFRSGEIVSHATSDRMLKCLDLLHMAMLPSPGGMSGSPAECATQLLSQSTEEPMINGEPLPIRQSYASWRKFLQSLIGSRFWVGKGRFSGLCQDKDRKSGDKYFREATLLFWPNCGFFRCRV